MTLKYLQKSVGFMVSLTFRINLPVRIIEKSKNVHCAVSNVFKFLKTFFHLVCSQIGNESFKYLNSWTLIKEEQIARRI